MNNRAATYCRFSTDRQSRDTESGSIAQQEAIASDYAARSGLVIVERYVDEAISGAAIGNRPGLNAMLAAAERGDFDALIVTDLSRLSRSQADLPRLIERLAFRGVRVIGVQDGFDSTREDSDLSAGLHGIMGQAFRKMVASRTRAALKQRAERGSRAGGKPYGYRCTETDGGRALVIDDEQAGIVREIFDRYGSGASVRMIATDLNNRAIPSPGATWAREKRRKDGKWLGSAVYSMLQNEVYRGEVIWNRSRWVKDPDSGVRRRVERPRSEWIVREAPELRIVSDGLWNAVQSRIHARVTTFAGPADSRRGAQPRHLLSGLLVCSECGSKLIVSGPAVKSYVCSSYKNGGRAACSNSIYARKSVVESRLLESLKADLLSPDAVRTYVAEYTKARKAAKQSPAGKTKAKPAKVARLDAQIAELENLLKAGRLSPAVAGAALAQARAEREALTAANDSAADRKESKVARVFPEAAQELREQVGQLEQALTDPRIVGRARPIVHALLGGRVPVRPSESGDCLVAEVELSAVPLLRAAGADLSFQNGSGGRI